MKNAIKKITATLMAFTLLSTGTAVTKTFFPNSDNTLVASAEELCQNVSGSKYKVVAKHGVNIRKSASVDSKKIGSLAKGSTFTILEKKSYKKPVGYCDYCYEWGKVRVNGGYGWICLNENVLQHGVGGIHHINW